MTFFSDGDSGTPSLHVQAANTWYDIRDTYVVRFVADGCRKNLPVSDTDMAWGGLIFATPPNATLESLPSDYAMPSLGSSPDVRAALENLFPDDEHSHGKSNIRTETGWVELNYESDGSVDSLSVRSNADKTALSILRSVCNRFSARLYDNQTSDFADFDGNSSSSMVDFRDFRDRNLPPSA